MLDHYTGHYIRRYKRQFLGIMFDCFKDLGVISKKFDDLDNSSLLNVGSISQLQDDIEKLRSKLQNFMNVLDSMNKRRRKRGFRT
ncbi:MAG: hypothetical protein WBB28_25245 [Crinalium sp.]